MAWMNSKESILAAIKGTVHFIRNVDQDPEYCEDKVLAMLKTAYENGRGDVHSGQSNDILSMETMHSHTF